jgi:DUF2938 family protein
MLGFTLHYVVAGVIATLCMDVLSGLAIALGMAAPLPPRLIGRWFVSVAKASPIHADIAQASPIAHEMAIVLPVHYAIGIVLTALYLVASSRLAWQAENLKLAVTFGVLSSALPWIFMFPAMGYGFFGIRGPAGTRLFVSSLISHACFGLGLWVGALVISRR